MDTSGFYKLDNEVLYAPNGVSSLDYELHRSLKDTFTLPIGGWYWFDTKEDAYAFFGVDLPATE